MLGTLLFTLQSRTRFTDDLMPGLVKKNFMLEGVPAAGRVTSRVSQSHRRFRSMGSRMYIYDATTVTYERAVLQEKKISKGPTPRLGDEGRGGGRSAKGEELEGGRT